ncbi:tRNA (N6-isopentenyl adenosine(37)-C2)-methylthiotransferase MiaB [Allomeiothermus silvanus]|uniref:tRNA (N6-isopentenyl adenosine(37)-C2)-methylthiotransferase MiaB n=1 Tax=Allomeiothermus silvanus TaxID=52022 RepID=UPI0023F508D6|nr:tRNA (N6-isopentenyl adenosine(37)-C2)-methylthiotransferase MiaB [Allomeiothermus silvanus]
MKTHIITYGCQMNEYDTHLVKSELASLGAEFVDTWQEADFVLVNTCAVRGKPVEKVRSLLGELRKEKDKRDLMVGMMGCLAQLEEGQQIARKFGVDILLGPGALTEIGKALEAKSRFWELSFREELAHHLPPAPQGQLSAFVSIIRGCNHHCTYCIVPTTRGPEVSRHPDLILREIEQLKAAGVVEVTLLGQNVNSYGNDQPGFPKFAELLRMVGQIGIPRIKFTTSHPVNFTDEVIRAMAETPQVCEYIHLPVQSGSNRVLRRMGREYRREWYLDRIRAIREAMPEVVLSTDIIVGFPGETEEDFQETLSLYDQVGYDSAYMFIYSPRPGTPSYKHFQDLPREVKVERLQRLIEKQKQWSYQQNQRWVGRTLEVLVRGAAKDDSYAEGHSRGNHPVLVPASQAPRPGLYQVVVKQATPHMLLGEVVGAEEPATIPLMMA